MKWVTGTRRNRDTVACASTIQLWMSHRAGPRLRPHTQN